MAIAWYQKIVSAVSIIAFSCSACAQQADFNLVGKQVAIMLQNMHFSELPYNEALSKRILTDYLKDLDPKKLYFTQEDVNQFDEEYGKKLHTLLLGGKGVSAGDAIFQVYRQRVEEKVLWTEKLLKEDLDFTETTSIKSNRKNVPWPKNEQVAQGAWRLHLKEEVLSEILIQKAVKKTEGEIIAPKEKVATRYRKFLNSVRDVDAEEVANYFLSAVAGAYDPHTDYMSFRESGRFSEEMRNELIGIGALLQEEDDGGAKVMGIVVNGPADKEGSLKLNDRIIAVDSLNTGVPADMKDVKFLKIDKVIDLVRGEEGTSVALKVESANGVPGGVKKVIIKREKVEKKDGLASGEVVEMRGNGDVLTRVGVMTLPLFYDDFEEGKTRCSTDVEKLLKRLVEEKIDGLVFDLRGNGGGSLEEVRRMTGFFVGGGPVVQVKKTTRQIEVKDADREKPIYAGPMVVIVDRSSASASEIFAGALQDYNRAVIVGDASTYGKGTVQQPMDVGRMLPLFVAREHAGVLKVTIQKFYRPSGSSTQLDGVSSDVVLPSMSDVLEFGESYLDHRLDHDRIRPASDFKPLDIGSLFLPRLKELSQQRVSESKDFRYVIEDSFKTKERMKLNESSLNLELREKQLAEAQALKNERNAERRVRFASMAAEDLKVFRFYKLSLDALGAGGELKEYHPSDENTDYMRRAKEEVEEADREPRWPSGLDMVKRESLMVLNDLILLTENAELAGLMKDE